MKKLYIPLRQVEYGPSPGRCKVTNRTTLKKGVLVNTAVCTGLCVHCCIYDRTHSLLPVVCHFYGCMCVLCVYVCSYVCVLCVWYVCVPVRVIVCEYM